VSKREEKIERKKRDVFMSEKKETSETYLLNRYMNLKQNYVLHINVLKPKITAQLLIILL